MTENAAAAVAETHASVVFFVGDRAYKLKKPVSLGFLDFSTRELREAACRREVQLNRRLAPDVYLGVADIVGPDREVCDHLVVMRRMPVDRRLSALIGDATATREQIAVIARMLAAFHARADASPHIDDAGTVESVRANWMQSFEQMRSFVGPVLSENDAGAVEALALRYLAGRAALFHRRITEGRIRDGHGDLLADDIFVLDDGARILDCIEFADRYRHGDVLADIAFLAMDLEYQGAPYLGAFLIDRWGELSAETHPASLAHHYIAYRSHVRCKVACLRAAQGDARATDDAVEHLTLARQHLERAAVTLAIVGGLPGTGKSTLADSLGARLGWIVLRSDLVRKELLGIAGHASAADSYGQGAYGAHITDQAYGELLRRARCALEQGESVILDASWTARPRREAARHVAESSASDLVDIQCVAPGDVAADRLRARTEAFGSDATPEIARTMAERADAVSSAHALDTDRPAADVLADALALLPPAG
ncbi:MAG: bifunctional aminoglycoside phosphotransferase/ATP-binding protein [Actinomycetota bacterium]